MDIRATIGKIFEKGNPGLGWFIMWRMALVMIPLNVVSRIAIETSPNPLGAVGTLFALPVGGNVFLVPIAIPVTLFLWHWLGRMAMVKRLGVSPRGFVGWALYWRFVLLQLSGVIALGLVLAPIGLIASNFGEAGMVTFSIIAAVVGLPGLIYWNLNVIGFVVKRVAAQAPQAEAEAPAEDEGRVRIRHFRRLFDAQAFGMNWMIAGAFFMAAVAGLLIFPLIGALFSGEVHFMRASNLAGAAVAWTVAAVGMAFLLHRMNHEWEVVGLLALLMVASLVIIEAPLSAAIEGDLDRIEWFAPVPILQRLSFNLFFIGGLMAGLRLFGPGIAGLAGGIAAGELIHIWLAQPLIYDAFDFIPLSAMWGPENLARGFLIALVDGAVTAALLWWASDWHLSRRNLRLTQDGSIVPRGARGPAPAAGA